MTTERRYARIGKRRWLEGVDELPVFIQHFRMRLMRFDFTIEHVPGKPLFPADSRSRSPHEDEAHDPKPWNDIRVLC